MLRAQPAEVAPQPGDGDVAGVGVEKPPTPAMQYEIRPCCNIVTNLRAVGVVRSDALQ